MSKLNLFKAAGQGVANTGNPTAAFTPKNFVGAILVPSTRVFTKTEVDTLDTVLVAGAKADDPLARFYPITRFQDVNDDSTEAKEYESAYGDTFKLVNGKPQWTFGLYDKSLYSWANLFEFDNQQSQWSVIFIDEQNNTFLGTSKDGGMAGFPLNRLSISNPKLNDASTPFSHMITFGLKTVKDIQRYALRQFNDDYDVVEMCTGLITVSPTATTSITSGGLVSVQLIAADTDMYATYSAAIAATGAWRGSINSGAWINSSAAAVTTGADTWDVTFGTVSSGDVLEFGLEVPSALEALSVPGYESKTITVTIP